ncbi:proprotein convertase, P [Novosphingobium sp. BL-8H]|uniref:proprotein convertase, P n=1 Tax=Novosphingobium sp. BL-8H TaxID=3127640 RepID=UPI003756E14D
MTARLLALFTALAALLLAGTAQAQSATAAWSSLGLSNGGSVGTSTTMTASDGTTVSTAWSTTVGGSGTFAVASGYNNYVVYNTGAVGNVSPNLLLNFDASRFDANNKITMDITLGRSVTGLAFTLADVDRETGSGSTYNQDAVAVYYDTGNGTFVNAAGTSYWTDGSAVTSTSTGWYGNAASTNGQTRGNIAFDFGTLAVKRIRIVYNSYAVSGTANPNAQFIVLSGLAFDGKGADLSLANTLLTSNPTAGGLATFRLTVSNASTSTDTATNVKVTDTLPDGFTYVSSNGTGSFNAATGVWTVGSVAPGASVTIDITGTVNASAGATLTNIAEISASDQNDPDSTPGNGATGEDDYASATLTVSGSRVAGTPPTLSCAAGTVVFDWSNRAWTAGSTSNSYSFDTLGTINFALTNQGTWLSSSTYGGQSPVRQNVVNGGLNDYALFEMVNMPSVSAEATTTITLPTALPGAQFKIFDVDYYSGQFADKVTVEGRYNGATVTPTLTNGVSNYVIGNSAYGDGLSDDASADGTVTVTFAQPIDTIVIRYGNHSMAPSDPGQQAIALHDITFCRPSTTLAVSKTSSVVSDPVSGTNNPKAIPGATVRYCILVANTGSSAATSVTASDPIPSTLTYIAGSITSGSDCASATTAEDDNDTGSDESDPYGASYASGTVKASAPTLGAGTSFAIRFDATVN